MFGALIQPHFDCASSAWSHLTLFFPMFTFYPPEKEIKREHWEEKS